MLCYLPINDNRYFFTINKLFNYRPIYENLKAHVIYPYSTIIYVYFLLTNIQIVKKDKMFFFLTAQNLERKTLLWTISHLLIY